MAKIAPMPVGAIFYSLININYLLILLIIQSKIQAPTTDTKILWRLKPVIVWAPRKLKTNPPMKAPIIPIIILSINPVLESISLLAIQPDKAPSTNQAIIPILVLLLFILLFMIYDIIIFVHYILIIKIMQINYKTY